MNHRQIRQQLHEMDHLVLFERLLKVPEIKLGRSIRSPLREGDKHPSFNIFRSRNGQVRFNDFAYKGGDVYDLVKMMYNCNFTEALEILAGVAGLAENSTRQMVRPLPPLGFAENNAKTVFTPRGWDHTVDIPYWNRLNITPEIATEMGLLPAQSFSIWREETPEKVFTINSMPMDPLYVFVINDHVKAYRPLTKDKKRRYIGNTTSQDVFGLQQADGKKPLVICAGQKDALACICNIGCNAVSFNSESSMPSETLMMQVHMKSLNSPFLLYDNDPAGELNTRKLSRMYPFLRPINLASYTTVKDLSDVVEQNDTHTLQCICRLIHLDHEL